MKKIISLSLSLALVMTLLVGCGDKDSSYFKEMNKMTNITTGTGISELSIESSDTLDMPQLTDNGKTKVNIKIESTQESSTKVALKVSAKFGKSDYADVTTVVLDENKLYLDIGSIVDTIKLFDEEAATEIETTLASIGAAKKVSIDLKQVYEAMDIQMPEREKSQEAINDFAQDLMEILEKSFDGIQGKDGSDYTLTVNDDNADKAVDALNNFCKNDLKEVYTKLTDLIMNMYGSDSQISKQYEAMKKDTSAIDEAAKGISDEEKEKAIKAIKDTNMNVVSKINISGKEGSRVAKFSIVTGDIVIPKDESESGKEEKSSMSFTSEIKEGKVSIKDMVPTDAMDLTAMFMAMMNVQQAEVQ